MVTKYPPLVIRVGEPLQWGEFEFFDIDWLPDPEPDPEPGKCVEITGGVDIRHVTICDPCGIVVEYRTNTLADVRGWRGRVVGTYRVGMLIEDKCPTSQGECCTDESIMIWFNVQVLDGDDKCPAGAGAACERWDPSEALGIQGLERTFSLGTTYDGESAGALVIEADGPSPLLAQPSSLKYPFENPEGTNNESFTPGVFVYRHGVYGEFQVKTPHLVADVERMDDFSYAIAYYAIEQLEAWQDNHYRLTGAPYRRYVVENPDGVYADNRLFVTESVLIGSAYAERVRWEYEAFETQETHGWQLGIKQGISLFASAVLTIEPIVPLNRFVRTLVVKDPWGRTTYDEEEVWQEFMPPGARLPVALPVKRIVDPRGAALTTEWGYEHTSNGVRLKWVKRPDGSWTWYRFAQASGSATFDEISGWRDTGCPAEAPAVGGAGTRSLSTVYLLPDGVNPGQLESIEEWIEDVLVRKSEYFYNVPELPPGHRLELRWTGESDYLEAYRVDSQDRPDRPLTVVDVDKNRRDYVYDDTVHYNPATHEYNLDPGPQQVVNARYRETTYGYDDGEPRVVAGKSTRRILISDLGGLPYFAETWVYTASGWVRIAWTAWTYDEQRRVTGIYRHDGTYQTIAYTSCCNRVVTDSTGVSTTYQFDPLGRVVTVTRAEIPAYGDYPAQPAIQTTYTYGDPVNERRITVSTSAGWLTEASYQDFDLAGRVVGVTTGSGDGQFKTLYEYGYTAGGGRKVITYQNYPPAATQGTGGTRDRITEYYRDGQLKSITGTGVVPTYYVYSAAQGSLRTTVYTGSNPSPRYVTTTYDMLGRVRTTERPGVTSALTTTYYYDDSQGYSSTGRLVRIEPPDGADTVFEYDPLGRVTRTALDVNGNGSADPNGTDRLTDTDAKYEQYDNAWWWVTRSWVYPDDNDPDAVETGSRWQRVSGHVAAGVVREIRICDELNDLETKTTTVIDRQTGHALVTENTVYPDAASPALRYLRGGRLQRDQSKTGVLTVYGYDALGRRTSVTDARGNVTETAYDASGRPVWVEDGADHRTEYGYYVSGDAFPGQLKYVENPDDKRAYYAYNARGQTVRTWGDVPNPTETVYDDYGQRVALKTFRGGTWTGSTWPDPAPDADQTQWLYDDATGLLEEQQYADETSTTYTYTNDGKLNTRTWARDVTTTYAYDANTAELTGITYSDGTTAVGFQYDRLGRRKQVVDAAGTRVFAYNAALQPTTETFSGDLFGGQVITQLYQDGTGGTVQGRFRGVQVGNPGVYYTATYGYDAVGRLNHVTGPGLPTGTGTYHGAWYGFVSGTDLLDTLQFKDSNNLVRAWTKWDYDADRDLVTSRRNNWGTVDTYTTISQYSYTYDNLDLRTYNQRSGAAFAGPFYEVYTHNDRQELLDSDYLTGTYNTGTPVPDADLAYTYDPIGNRGTFVEDPNTPDATTTYFLNELNQYHRSRRYVAPAVPLVAQGFRYDDDGNLAETFISGDMNCDGQVNFGDVNAFVLAVSNPAGYQQQYPNCNILNGDINGDGLVDYGDVNAFVALLGHTAGGVGLRSEYIWDAENRLVRVKPTTPISGDKKVEFKYDYLGRRVDKRVYDWVGPGPDDWATTPTVWQKFMYFGWLPILELDALAYDEVLRAYTWGLDLSGTLDGLAGVGGLLAVQAPGANPYSGGNLNAIYMYDAGGNVGQLVAWTTGFGGIPGNTWHAGRLLAHYEYDPCGRIMTQSGFYAAANPFRWSTKRFDPETGLADFGLRYYSATLGRWINRDPIGDLGGANVYAYVGNNPTNLTDYLGMMWAICLPGEVCGSSPGGDDPPQEKEEEDKKPCPKKPDLYQQSQPTTPVSPGQICGPVPNANPTDADCCNAARPCANGDGGGVICCNGRKVSCSFLQPNPNTPGDHVIAQCLIAHEDDHHDDVSCSGCPAGQICRPGLDPGKNRNNEECSARSKEIDCLFGQMRTTCFFLPNVADQVACARLVERRIEDECSTMRHNLKCKTLPSKCFGYGI